MSEQVEQLNIKLARGDRARIQRRAEKVGKNYSEFVRMLIDAELKKDGEGLKPVPSWGGKRQQKSA